MSLFPICFTINHSTLCNICLHQSVIKWLCNGLLSRDGSLKQNSQISVNTICLDTSLFMSTTTAAGGIISEEERWDFFCWFSVRHYLLKHCCRHIKIFSEYDKSEARVLVCSSFLEMISPGSDFYQKHVLLASFSLPAVKCELTWTRMWRVANRSLGTLHLQPFAFTSFQKPLLTLWH